MGEVCEKRYYTSYARVRTKLSNLELGGFWIGWN